MNRVERGNHDVFAYFYCHVYMESNNVAWSQLIDNVPYKNLSEMEAFTFRSSHKHKDKGFFPYKLIGRCMLFHKDLITKIGGLDERFFLGNY